MNLNSPEKSELTPDQAQRKSLLNRRMSMRTQKMHSEMMQVLIKQGQYIQRMESRVSTKTDKEEK